MTKYEHNSGSSCEELDLASRLEHEVLAGTDVPCRLQKSDATRVLLVNDSATVRESACANLRASGYLVTLASNGFEALARVVQNRPDVVFADAAMPGLDGYQICALLKSNSDYQHIPVIMMTGREGLVDQERAKLVGCASHVCRPFTAQTLSAAACGVYHLHRSGDVLSQAVPMTDDYPD